jgi:hypothetical protein
MSSHGRNQIAPPRNRCRRISAVTFPLTVSPRFSYNGTRISLTSGSSTGDSRLMGRVRFLRAGLVTPLPGGPGIGPAGITTGARGAPLKRDRKRRPCLRVFIARSTAWAESKRSVAATSAAVERREASGPRWGRFRAAGGFAQTAQACLRCIGKRQRLLVRRGQWMVRLSALRLPFIAGRRI